MNSQTFDPAKPITIWSIFNDFKLECNTNTVQEGTAMWPLCPFMEKPSSAIRSACTSSKPRKKRLQAEGTLSKYCKVANCLLSICVTDNIIDENNGEMTTSKQRPNMNPCSIAISNVSRHSNVVRYRTSQCSRAFS